MRSRYSLAATRGPRTAPAATAPARPTGAARHQLWHLSSPLLRALLLLAALPALSQAQTISGTDFDPVAGQNGVLLGATQAAVMAASATSLTVPLGTTYQYPTVANLTTARTADASQPTGFATGTAPYPGAAVGGDTDQ
ncbi:hypothetical protein [Hymenobacter convexus]|uniref:hypothetical protein n=1 Tax=Hymenobacter sp. CA1UV-4 TaxID=3063782 RepID=UPI0027138F02|nr:hypothetical protein [Hymenobacter sp. CA1UV-4]MDO7854504.1 hypothetical protein [Hymenobacter sp. CA1UV-4]